MGIEFTETDNGFIIVYGVYKKSKGSVKICKGFVKGKEY